MVTSWYKSSKAIDLHVDLTGDRPKSLNAHPAVRSRRIHLLTYFNFYVF